VLQARGATATSHDIDPTLLEALWQLRSGAAGDAELSEDSAPSSARTSTWCASAKKISTEARACK